MQNRSLEFGLGLTLPAAVGFMIMPEVLVAIVYERAAASRGNNRAAGGSVLAALPSAFPQGFHADFNFPSRLLCA
ncbi:MAG: hypothetical protein R3D29_03855 [Nitratireductor sp.]